MSITQSVRKVVFSALLTALTDIMGEDGKKSILRFAGLSRYINEEVQPSLSESISFEDFSALLKSMNSLLGHGTHAILYESGRKFALYLSPFGISLEDIIKKLEEWIGGEWSFYKDPNDPDIIHIKIKNNPISKDITANNPVCHIISGTLARFKEEATGEKFHVKEIKCIAMGDEACEFIIKPEKATKIKEKIG